MATYSSGSSPYSSKGTLWRPAFMAQGTEASSQQAFEGARAGWVNGNGAGGAVAVLPLQDGRDGVLARQGARLGEAARRLLEGITWLR